MRTLLGTMFNGFASQMGAALEQAKAAQESLTKQAAERAEQLSHQVVQVMAATPGELAAEHGTAVGLDKVAEAFKSFEARSEGTITSEPELVAEPSAGADGSTVAALQAETEQLRQRLQVRRCAP